MARRVIAGDAGTKTLAQSQRGTDDRLKAMRALTAGLEHWKPAGQVLTTVRAVPSGFIQVDRMTRFGGWPTNRVSLIHGPSNEGKALAVETPVLTPTGWKPIGAIKKGEFVIGSNGSATRVVGVYPQGPLDLYRVTFSDGASVECCADHLWFTSDRRERSRGIAGGVRSLAEILEGFEPGDHAVPLVRPVEFEPLGNLPIDPYLLGLMIGDGGYGKTATPKFHKPEADLRREVASRLPLGDVLVVKDKVTCAIVGGGLTREMRKLEMWGARSWEKEIPDLYMRAPIADRRELLAGLLDTDGSVTKDGNAVEFSSTSMKLADQVVELARGLGAYVTQQVRQTSFTHRGERRPGRPSRRIRIYFDDGYKPVRSAKHCAKWLPRRRRNLRTIVSIEPTSRREAVCIRVDADDHLFVTDQFIVTHNTAFLIGLGLGFLRAGHFFGYVDAERTTMERWLQQLMTSYADHPGFIAMKPDSYEQTADAVRDFADRIIEGKRKGDIPQDMSGVLAVDSLVKLMPKRLWAEITKSDDGEGRGARGKSKTVGIDGMAGRAAQYKAALNSQWMNQLVIQMDNAGLSMVLVGREYTNTDTDMFAADWKLGGGGGIFFDSALVLRIQREGYVMHGTGKEAIMYGERHFAEMRKTKIGVKEERYPRAYFHTSNGMLDGVPAGFDPARDLLELAIEMGVVDVAGSHYRFDKRRIGQGEHAAVRLLATQPEIFAAVEEQTRDAYRKETR